MFLFSDESSDKASGDHQQNPGGCHGSSSLLRESFHGDGDNEYIYDEDDFEEDSLYFCIFYGVARVSLFKCLN